jgi:hypothetical protein
MVCHHGNSDDDDDDDDDDEDEDDDSYNDEDDDVDKEDDDDGGGEKDDKYDGANDNDADSSPCPYAVSTYLHHDFIIEFEPVRSRHSLTLGSSIIISCAQVALQVHVPMYLPMRLPMGRLREGRPDVRVIMPPSDVAMMHQHRMENVGAVVYLPVR